MKDETKEILITLVVIILGVILFLIWKKKKEKKEATSTAEEEVYSIAKKTPVTVTRSEKSIFPLKKGSRGEEVLLLQKALNYLYGGGSTILSTDGIFGAQTEKYFKDKYGKSEVDADYYKVITTMYKNGTNLGITSKNLADYYVLMKGKNETINMVLTMLYENRVPEYLINLAKNSNKK